MNQLVENIKKASSYIPKALSYSLPLKIAIGFLLTALGSSSVLGFLSELAVYKYALVNGFRVPVEGIPYLRPTVTIISLLILLVALLTFLLTYSLAKYFSASLAFPDKVISLLLSLLKIKNSTYQIKSIMEELEYVSTLKAILLSVITSAIICIIVILGMKYQEFVVLNILNETFRIHLDYKPTMAINNIKAITVIFLMTFAINLTVFKPTLTKGVSLCMAGASVLMISLFMFNNSLYSDFLKTTGFGGGREITIYSKKDQQSISGKLLIQSNERYIILLPSNDIIEFPVIDVNRVKYEKNKNTSL